MNITACSWIPDDGNWLLSFLFLLLLSLLFYIELLWEEANKENNGYAKKESGNSFESRDALSDTKNGRIKRINILQVEESEAEPILWQCTSSARTSSE